MGVVFCRGIDWIKSGEERCTLSWEVEELGASTRGLRSPIKVSYFGSKEVRSPTPCLWGMRRLEREQRRCSGWACSSVAASVFIVSVLY